MSNSRSINANLALLLQISSMIRLATLDDLPALAALERLCFTQDRIQPAQFRRFILRDNALLLAALVQKVLAGSSLVLLRKGSTQARLYSFAVAPTYRGTGLATDLLCAAEEQAKAHGSQKMVLEVRKNNARAIHFYEKSHYHLLSEIPHFYDDNTDALKYIKDLEAS